MKAITKTALSLGVVLGLVAIGGVAAVYSGVYNVGADDPHTRPVYTLLEIARDRSIAARAGKLQAPANLHDLARIRQGAGNYSAMCADCHLSPGSGPTELSQGLYPAPPDLTKEIVDASTAFWTIKHGIKASGMPAWGKSMEDEYIWNMAAFLQQLPQLDTAQYDALVASSGGHSHGGGETGGHAQANGEADRHDEGDSHTHAEEAKPTVVKPAIDPHAGMDMPKTKPASDGHDHQH